jgi:hypothetical protein
MNVEKGSGIDVAPGFDAGKLIKGKKSRPRRTPGLALHALVAAADVQRVSEKFYA